MIEYLMDRPWGVRLMALLWFPVVPIAALIDQRSVMALTWRVLWRAFVAGRRV